MTHRLATDHGPAVLLCFCVSQTIGCQTAVDARGVWPSCCCTCGQACRWNAERPTWHSAQVGRVIPSRTRRGGVYSREYGLHSRSLHHLDSYAAAGRSAWPDAASSRTRPRRPRRWARSSSRQAGGGQAVAGTRIGATWGSLEVFWSSSLGGSDRLRVAGLRVVRAAGYTNDKSRRRWSPGAGGFGVGRCFSRWCAEGGTNRNIGTRLPDGRV